LVNNFRYKLKTKNPRDKAAVIIAGISVYSLGSITCPGSMGMISAKLELGTPLRLWRKDTLFYEISKNLNIYLFLNNFLI